MQIYEDNFLLVDNYLDAIAKIHIKSKCGQQKNYIDNIET